MRSAAITSLELWSGEGSSCFKYSLGGGWDLRVWLTVSGCGRLSEQEWQPDKVGQVGWGSWKPQYPGWAFGKVGSAPDISCKMRLTPRSS